MFSRYCRLVCCFAVLFAGSPAYGQSEANEGPAPGNMRFNWIHGSISAKATPMSEYKYIGTTKILIFCDRTQLFIGKHLLCIWCLAKNAFCC